MFVRYIKNVLLYPVVIYRNLCNYKKAPDMTLEQSNIV